MQIVDLRSDTVTKPSERMRKAMAEAVVGDDVYREDPTVNKLQRRACEIFGREAALFVPSGTMSNSCAIKAHTEPGMEVICERHAHIINYEHANMCQFSGVLPRVVDGEDGIMRWEDIETEIRYKTDHTSWTGLICLENSVNTSGGTVYSMERTEEICRNARERKIPTHVDGARIFNAAVALGINVQSLTKEFDSVSFCFSKGLGAPVGSMLVGSKDFIEKARRVRKVLGGGMRQAGSLAAAALIALEESPARLHEDHANARWMAERLTEIPGLQIQAEKVVTNILIFDVAKMDGYAFIGKLAAEGVLANPITRTRVRFVTHCDVDRSQIEKAVESVRKIMA